MKVAIYSRVSTDKQSHDSQMIELRDYCTRRGWDQVTEYTDQISGGSFSRGGLATMMKEVRRGRLDTLICFKLDRLGRSLGHLVQLIGELTTNKVALICPGQGIDTSDSNPVNQLQLHILGAIAEFERSIIRDRVQAGLKAAKSRGVKLWSTTIILPHRRQLEFTSWV